MTETETWRAIPGYEKRYQASTWGNIRSIIGLKPRMLTLRTYKNSPYYKVQLLDASGNKKCFRVHRLIYITFVGPIPEGLVLDHINGNKKDNSVSNLRAVTVVENCRNPHTRENYHNRYHRPGEHERRSAGQRRRFARPEEREHLLRISKKGRETMRRNRLKRSVRT